MQIAFKVVTVKKGDTHPKHKHYEAQMSIAFECVVTDSFTVSSPVEKKCGKTSFEFVATTNMSIGNPIPRAITPPNMSPNPPVGTDTATSPALSPVESLEFEFLTELCPKVRKNIEVTLPVEISGNEPSSCLFVSSGLLPLN